jgi:hypothetical protein
MQSEPPNKVPSLKSSLLTGGLGFGLVSLCVFATVAFGESWMYENLGLTGAYIAWTALFILLGGGVFGSLVIGRWRLPKFYLLFGLAFLAYAVNWVAAYFVVRGRTGELIGSLAGSLLMGSVLTIGLGSARSDGAGVTVRTVLSLSALLFVANSVGYFLGSAINNSLGGRPGMLLWGTIYGLCLGAGLGVLIHFAQGGRRAT